MRTLIALAVVLALAGTADAAVTYQFKKSVLYYDHVEATCEFNDGAGLVWTETRSWSRDDVSPYNTLSEFRAAIVDPWAKDIVMKYQKLKAINTAIQNNLNVTITP